MKYKKSMIMLVLVIFIFGVASVCASDVNDTVIAGADDSAVELPQADGDEIISTDESELIGQTDNELISEGTSGTFAELQAYIKAAGSTLTLNKSYECEDGFDSEGILIDKTITIDGQGYKIDAQKKSRIFNITADNVVLKNIIFTNGKATGDGGAIHFENSGTVTNCNFTNNSAWYGGAIDFEGSGTVSNCNFTNNTASGDGGAIYFDNTGNVENCNFAENKVTGDYSNGGAICMDSGTVTNCNFTNNTATNGDGGAVYFVWDGTVTNCNFAGNTAVYGGAINMGSGTVSNCNFTNNQATGSNSWGGAILFDSNGNVTNCNFTNNTAEYGGAVYFYQGTGSVTNCNFTDNQATGDGGAIYFAQSGSAINCNFTNNTARYGGAIDFEGSGTVSNCNFTGNNASGDGGAIWIYSGTVTNCNFTNNTASNRGGAIYFSISGSTHSVENCNFTNNTASRYGGAVYFNNGEVTNCNFTNNTATGDGGAINMGSGTVSNCNFTGNNATTGSAIYFWSTSASKTVSNSCFLNNRANAEALDVVKNDNNITITFTGHNNLLNAIYSREDAEVTFTNVKYWGANGITTISATLSGSNKAAGQNITVGIVVNDEIVLNQVYVTDEDGTIVLNINASDNYYISVRHDTDSYYTEAEKTISNNTKFNVNVTSQTTNNKTVNITAKSNIYSEAMPGKLLFIVPTGENITANYAGNGTWWAVYEFADYGDYQVNATYVGLDNVTINNGTISISKIPTEIIINAASLDLFVGDEIVIVANLTPEDAGNVTFTSSNESVVEVDAQGNVIAQGKGQAIITVSFAGNNKYAAAENRTINVTVSLNDASVTVDNNTLNLKAGETYAINATKHPDTIMLDITYTSSNSSVVTVDKKGIVTAVGVGTAVITVEVGDDEIYAKNSTNVTVTVSKVPTEIGAKPVTATYNINKNLIITLKDANGNPVTGVSLSVDLNGAKKYTTDKNGQVKVSTKGLDPKTYTVKITFNGNANYVKSAKNVKVTVKKAKPKIIAKKKKTYGAKAKTKKLKITLKDNTGKPIKNAKVRLMLKKIGKGSKKKTKSKANKKIAKTNKNGKATFKVKKNKKAKYLAYVKFYANKHYMKTVKKIKITIK